MLPIQKQLEPIVPFNELFYKGCFFNSLFSLLPVFGRSELPLLFTDMVVYKRHGDSSLIEAEYKQLTDTPGALLAQGIEMIAYDDVNSLISLLKQSISKGRPAIVSVDCYKLPERKDTFNKLHWPHTLLVYGFDDAEERFFVVEHRDKDSLNYAKRLLSYSDLQNAFDSFQEVFLKRSDGKRPDWPLYAEFAQSSAEAAPIPANPQEIAASYEQSFIQHRAALDDSAEALKQFTAYFGKLAQNETLALAEAEALLSHITGIVNAKLVEKYRLGRIVDESSQALEHVTAIIADWNFVRGVVGKLFFSNQFKPEAFREALCKLEQLEARERGFVQFWQQGGVCSA